MEPSAARISLRTTCDDPPGASPELVDDAQETTQVRRIEGGLHFVEHVERARPSLEDGEEKRQGGQAALPAGEQSHGGDLLAHRLGLDGHTRLGVIRVDQADLPSSPWEEEGEVTLIGRGDLGKGGPEPRLDLVVEGGDHFAQLGP